MHGCTNVSCFPGRDLAPEWAQIIINYNLNNAINDSFDIDDINNINNSIDNTNMTLIDQSI